MFKKIIIYFVNFIWRIYNFIRIEFKSFPKSMVALFQYNLHAKFLSNVVSFDEVCAEKKDDTIFIFGCGSSLSYLTDDQWREISAHQTMSFNYFFVQDFIDVDFHLIREIGDELDTDQRRSDLNRAIGDALSNNRRFKNAILIIQNEWKAYAARLLIASKSLPDKNKVLFFKNGKRGNQPISKSFDRGLTHGPGTLSDCINFAFLAGFKRIVLSGVDLNDRRYFWMIQGTKFFPVKGITFDGGEYSVDAEDTGEMHRTAGNMISFLAMWRKELNQSGVELMVLNPHSLLADVMPVYKFSKV